MSRNAFALKPSDSKRLDARLRSVTSSIEPRKEMELANVGDRVSALKDLIFALLKEVQGLEHDKLLSELTSTKDIDNLEIEKGIRFDDVVRQFETNIIRQALSITGGNQARAARLLGIRPNTLNYKIKIYNLY